MQDGMNDVYHGNSFSRSVANEMKKGAYYTDLAMCHRIGKLFSFPKDSEVTVLEPSVGDASAVRAVLSEQEPTCTTPLFAVELDHEVASQTKKEARPGDYILEADFRTGVKISSGVFGFCFSNPPYGEEPFLKRRLEQLFLERIYTFMKKDGILAIVVPFYVMKSADFIGSFMARFELLSQYRFDDDVYKKFQQIVLVGKRRQKLFYGFGPKQREEFFATVPEPESLSYLPASVAEEDKIVVPTAAADEVKVFASTVFDEVTAGDSLAGSQLYRLAGQKISGRVYSSAELSRPPVPLKKDLLYLCAISGGGQGLCGSEDEGDLHLQRGVVKVIKENQLVGEGDSKTIVEQTRSLVSMAIIENNGKITILN